MNHALSPSVKTTEPLVVIGKFKTWEPLPTLPNVTDVAVLMLTPNIPVLAADPIIVSPEVQGKLRRANSGFDSRDGSHYIEGASSMTYLNILTAAAFALVAMYFFVILVAVTVIAAMLCVRAVQRVGEVIRRVA